MGDMRQRFGMRMRYTETVDPCQAAAVCVRGFRRRARALVVVLRARADGIAAALTDDAQLLFALRAAGPSVPGVGFCVTESREVPCHTPTQPSVA